MNTTQNNTQDKINETLAKAHFSDYTSKRATGASHEEAFKFADRRRAGWQHYISLRGVAFVVFVLTAATKAGGLW